MVFVALKCPHCGSAEVSKNGKSNGKQRYNCNNAQCSQRTFYAEYTYNGCKPNIKEEIIKWITDGAGIRATA